MPDADARDARDAAAAVDVCVPATALRVVVVVQAVVAIGTLPFRSGADDAWLRLALPAVGALAATLAWLAATCALGRRLRRFGDAAAGLAAALAGALCGLAGWALATALGGGGLDAGLAWRGGSVALAAAAIAAATWHWLAMRAARSRPADARARLAELQSRIRPHFLFNALNGAIALVAVDPARAERVLEDLAELFRAALAESGATVTLAEETRLAGSYLAIEQLRFGERLRVHWQLDERAAGARLPPLVLQPLVENAVRHGIETSREPGDVFVSTRARRGMAEVEVVNTLPAGAPAIAPRPGAGIALANVRERLALLHDLAARLDAGVVDGRFRARIEVPL